MYKFGEPVDIKTARHLKRYDFVAAQLTKEKYFPNTIVDVACGSGYGSYLLSKAFPNATLTSYDISKEAIDFALKYNNLDKINYTTNFPDKSFDVSVFMDAIEHMPDDESDKIISKIDSPVWYISTPLYTFNGQSPTNPFHTNCYTKERFLEKLEKHFKSIELYHIEWNFYRKMTKTEKEGTVIAICKK